MKMLSKKILFVFLFVFCFYLSGCFVNIEESSDFFVKQVEYITLNINEKIEIENESYSSNNEVFSINLGEGTAISEGTVEVRRTSDNLLTHYICVTNLPKSISISGNSLLKIGEKSKLEIVVSPITANQQVEVYGYDNEIINISDEYEVLALKEGFTTLSIRSIADCNVITLYSILVHDEDEVFYEPDYKFGEEDVNISLDMSNDFPKLMNHLINNSLNSIVGVEIYKQNNNSLSMNMFGSGTIYRRDGILSDGTVVENIKYTDDLKNVISFRYYVITTKYLVQDADLIKIYLGQDYTSYTATLIEFDDKIDLSVISFESIYYFNTIKIGDSNKTRQGEFIISLGHSFNKNYFKSSTFGIISHTSRYLSTDTDGDEVSDWDSHYVQHDAPINDSDNGGIIINLKGEMIGVNSTKLSSDSIAVNGLSFAVPSNLVVEIVSMLEKGEKPQRALLGVTIFNIKDFMVNKDAYLPYYPFLATVPDDFEYGFYVNSVEPGGVAHMANVQIGDIILEFNGVTTKFSYQLRAELGKFIIGSGQSTYVLVYRNGEFIKLEVVF